MPVLFTSKQAVGFVSGKRVLRTHPLRSFAVRNTLSKNSIDQAHCFCQHVFAGAYRQTLSKPHANHSGPAKV